MDTRCSGTTKVYFPSILVHFTDVSLKNNTPVNTEVLWGGGLWWGLLRTSAPTAKHVQQVLDVDDTVTVGIARATDVVAPTISPCTRDLAR